MCNKSVLEKAFSSILEEDLQHLTGKKLDTRPSSWYKESMENNTLHEERRKVFRRVCKPLGVDDMTTAHKETTSAKPEAETGETMTQKAKVATQGFWANHKGKMSFMLGALALAGTQAAVAAYAERKGQGQGSAEQM